PPGDELPGRGGRRRRGPGGAGRAGLRPAGARMNLDLEYLERLTLRVRRGMGDRPGDRRFPGRPEPAGIELEAYAAYVPGDDLRHLDWNAVGRLDALLVRRFTAERELVVHLLVDASASMAVPARDGKLPLGPGDRRLRPDDGAGGGRARRARAPRPALRGPPPARDRRGRARSRTRVHARGPHRRGDGRDAPDRAHARRAHPLPGARRGAP